MGVSTPAAKPLNKREQTFIMANVGKLSFVDIAKKLQRSPAAIARYAEQHGYDANWTRVTDWKIEEDRFLRENHSTMLIKEMAKQLGRSIGGTQLRVGVLGLDKRSGRYRSEREWVRKEIAILRKLYSTHTYPQIAKELGRTQNSVKNKALELGLPSANIRPWTKKEDELLRELYATNSVQKIESRLGRNRADVAQRAKKLSIQKQSFIDAPWTKREVGILRKLYGTMTSTELGKKLGRSSGSVMHQAHRLGFRYPDEKMGKIWSADEDAKLRELFQQRLNHSKIAEHMNRSVGSTKARLRGLGLKYQERRKFLPPEQESALRKLYGTMSVEKIAQQINLNAASVRFYAKKFGLTYPEEKQFQFWKPEEDERLRQLFPTMSATEIAKEMGVSVFRVKGRLRMLGLKRFDRWWSTEPKAGKAKKAKK